jgi:hypothetical protein
MEYYTFLTALMTLVLTLVLGIMNYRLTSQTKNLEKLKNNYITILHNTLGFIELEKKYSEAYAEKSGEKSGSIKNKFRDDIINRINSDFSGEKKIRNLIEQIEKL